MGARREVLPDPACSEFFSHSSVSLDREAAGLKLNDYRIHLAGVRREVVMILIPEIRAPFDRIGSRVAHTGASLSTGVAYLVIILMLLTVVAEIFLVIMRALA